MQYLAKMQIRNTVFSLPLTNESNRASKYDGVKYQTSWLGGALNFFIFFSPTTGSYWACSPCVPGAGNLDQPGGSVVCYDVPRDWMRHDN